jgi:surfactin synthase thioesterase subunit
MDTPARPAVPPGRWLLRVPSAGSGGRIFCFPYSGVGASMFNRWPRWIGPFEVCPIQLPGRENRIREPCFTRYEEMAESLIGQLLPLLDRPFVFFGHCAGALPAYEVARRLAGTGLPAPGRLVVSAQVAPHDCPHDRFLGCTDDELVDELKALTVARGGEPHPALIELSLAVLRKDLEASGAYRLDEPAAVPVGITVLHWSGDPEVTLPELAGWKRYADDVRMAVLPGGHYEFLAAPATLLDLLAAQLRPARPGEEPTP